MTGSKSALIVVDIQNDFLPGGALAVEGGDKTIAAANGLMRLFDTVVLTADWHPAGHVSFASSHAGRAPFETMELSYGLQVLWPDHCVAGTPGAEFAAGLETERASVIVRKGMNPGCDSYSGFIEADRKTHTGLAGWLAERGVGRVFVCGLATDFCVAWTACDAMGAGFEAFIVEDACAAIDADGSMQQARALCRAVGVRLIESAELASMLSA